MFREVLRVLSAAGRYLCISLAEPFIFRHLLQHFAGKTPSPSPSPSPSLSCPSPVALSLHLVDRQQSPASAAASPFVPVLTEVCKGQAGRAGPPLQLHFDRFGTRTRPRDPQAHGGGVPLQTAIDTVAHLQDFRQMRFRLGQHPLWIFSPSL